MVRRNGADLAALVIGLTRSALVVSAGWLLLASSWSMSDGRSRWLLGGRPDIDAYADAVSAAMSQVDLPLALRCPSSESLPAWASCPRHWRLRHHRGATGRRFYRPWPRPPLCVGQEAYVWVSHGSSR